MKKATASSFLGIALLLAVAVVTNAQQPVKKSPGIGFLSAAIASNQSALFVAIRDGLQKLGYVEGQNMAFHYRSAGGKNDQLPALAAELVHLGVDVIVADSTLAARSAKAATTTIPIVIYSGDPVGTGLVASLSRPGGNVTGVTNLSPDLSTKRLEVLKESIPGVVRIAVLWDPEGPVPLLAFKETTEAARGLGLQIQSLEVRGPKPDIEGAFKAAIKGRGQALLIINNPLTAAHREQIVERAIKNRLPTIYADRRSVDVGGLMSYGVDNSALYNRLVHFVDRILKGTKPADLPVEQPTKFEFVVNLKTATQIGLTIPPNVLVRADRVIK